MGSNYIYEPYIHIQSSASSVWTVNHNFGRRVTVQILDSNDKNIYGDISYINNNTLEISFFESGEPVFITGTVIVG